MNKSDIIGELRRLCLRFICKRRDTKSRGIAKIIIGTTEAIYQTTRMTDAERKAFAETYGGFSLGKDGHPLVLTGDGDKDKEKEQEHG